MKTLLGILLVLIVAFSLGVGGYIAFFKTPLKALPAKIFTFLVLGAVATAFMFVICLVVIWPPVM